MMTPVIKTRITFDFDSDWHKSYDKLVQIICPARGGSGIDAYGYLNKEHSRFFDFVKKGAIVIDEVEYELQKPSADSEAARKMKSMLGKRRNHPVLRDMAALFDDEPFEASDYYRNTIYFPNLKAYMRADGIKPENIAGMLSLDGCDKIILFPYFPLDNKSAYYELTLAVAKESFVNYLNRIEQDRADRYGEALMRMGKQIVESERTNLRTENKADDSLNDTNDDANTRRR